jgi:hypothetical protein
VTVVDWGMYQKCRVCGALLGKPCLKFSGHYGVKARIEAAEEPHSTRKLRAAAARAGGDHG